MIVPMNVFISWSGARSKKVALLLREWLPNVIQAADVWMSDADIDAGVRGINEIFDQLEHARVGIICLTPENLAAPWLLFEAGALSKQVSEKSRVCPYLLGLEPTDISKPLAEFQAVRSDEDGTVRLVRSINKSLDQAAFPDEKVAKLVKVWWPDIRDELKKIRAEKPDAQTGLSEKELMSEVLGTNREIMRRLDEDIRDRNSEESQLRRLETLKSEQGVAIYGELFSGIMANPTFRGLLQQTRTTFPESSLDPSFIRNVFASLMGVMSDPAMQKEWLSLAGASGLLAENILSPSQPEHTSSTVGGPSMELVRGERTRPEGTPRTESSPAAPGHSSRRPRGNRQSAR